MKSEDARILDEDEAAQLDEESRKIREALGDRMRSTRDRDESEWV